jgi:hypothetical protein
MDFSHFDILLLNLRKPCGSPLPASGGAKVPEELFPFNAAVMRGSRISMQGARYHATWLRWYSHSGHGFTARAMVSRQTAVPAGEVAAEICRQSMVYHQVLSGEMLRPAALGFPSAQALGLFFPPGRG